MKSAIVSWKPVSPRLLTARLQHRHGKITVIVAYGPTELATEQTKDAYQEQLTHLIQSAPTHDVTIVLTDSNATLANDADDNTRPSIIGPVFVDHHTNDNGHRLVDVCRTTNLCIMDTWFPRKQIHHWTWYSNDGITRKSIDHILVSARWKSAVSHCRVYRGAQLGNTDHRMLVAEMRLRLQAQKQDATLRKLNTATLKDADTQHSFAIALQNRFQALPEEQWSDWPTFRTSVMASAQEAVGHRRPCAKQPWMSARTLEIVNQRRKARLDGNIGLYRRLNGARNASIRQDQETFWSREATQLEEASQRNDLRRLYGTLRKAKAEPSHRSFLCKDRVTTRIRAT